MITASETRRYLVHLITTDEDSYRKRHDFLRELPFLSVLAAFFLILYSSQQRLGIYDWPGIETAPVLVRLLDSTSLKNDDYTNANTHSPRRVFGYLAKNIATVTGKNWYETLLFLKILIVVALPCAMYLLLLSLLRPHLLRSRLDTARIILILLIPWSVFPKNPFSHLASWPALQLQTTPHAFSLLFSCLGGLAFQSKKRAGFTALVFFLCAISIHPVMTLFFWFFFLSLNQRAWKEEPRIVALWTVLVFFVPAYFIQKWFQGTVTLDAKEFVDIYVLWKHPFHYKASQFLPVDAHKFASLALFFLISWRMLRATPVALLPALFLAGSVAVQYVLTEVFPVRLAAALGPSRYLVFSYWYVCFFAVYMMASRVRVTLPPLARSLALLGSMTALVVYSPLARGVAEPLDRDETQLVEWAKTTGTDKLFASEDRWISTKLRLWAGRSLLADEAFPFNESSFRSHREAWAFLMMYRYLPLESVLAFARSRNLHYLVVHSGDLSVAYRFWSLPVVFENERFRVYSFIY